MDKSYYKSTVEILNVTESSTIGAPSPLGSGTNDAEDRFNSEPVKTYPSTSESLPVDLLSFEAIIVGQGVKLKWITTQEIQNDYFTVERFFDGINFYPIKTIPGAGDTHIKNYYETMDENPFSGKSYYRLKQTNVNRDFSFSSIISVSFYIKTKDFIAFPNPSEGHILNLEFLGFNQGEEVTVEILTIQGISVFSDKIRLKSAEQNLVKIELKRTIPTGIYNVVIKNKHLKLSKLFIVKK